MEETPKHLKYTLLGIQGMFFVWVLADIMFGMITVYAHYSGTIDMINSSIILQLALLILVIVNIFVGHIIYRRKIEMFDATWSIERKLRHYWSSYILTMGFWAGAGLLSQVGYWISNSPLWFIPWLYTLFVMGKNYPYKLNLCQILSLSEEERMLIEC